MKWLKIIASIYFVFCLGLYLIQEKIIFAAHSYPNGSGYAMGYEVEIPLEQDLEMNSLILPAKQGKRSSGAILYLHGNKGNIRRGIYQVRNMLGRGQDVMIIDYRGYGKTEGQPKNDKQLLEDANKAYQYLKQHYNESELYIVGYSLGTGMASYIAKMNNPAHLILVAPFTSLTDIKDKFLWMFPDFLLKYKLDNSRHLENLKTPTTILHGTNDDVVDYSFSEQLLKVNRDVELVTSEGQSHRGIIFDPLLSRTLDKVLGTRIQ